MEHKTSNKKKYMITVIVVMVLVFTGLDKKIINIIKEAKIEFGMSKNDEDSIEIKLLADLVTNEKYEEAIEKGKSLGEKVKDKKLLSYVHGLVGEAYFNKRDSEKALLYLNKSIELNDKFGETYFLRAQIYLALKNLPQAKESLLNALKYNTKQEYLSYYSLTLISFNNENFNEILEYGEKAWNLNKKDSKIASMLTMAYHVKKNKKKTEEFYQYSKELNSPIMDILDKFIGKKKG